MALPSSRPLPYVLSGLSTLTGTPIPIEDWAERARIPRRDTQEAFLSGPEVRRILGIDGKSWDPELFSSIDTLVELAAEALKSSGRDARDIGALVTVSCTPYQVNFDQDPQRLARRLGLRDEVLAVHLSSGCAGIARALALAAELLTETVLIVAYTVPSLAGGDGNGGLNDLYRTNSVHPHGDVAWISAGLFSDGAAAVVLERGSEPGTVLYSRECASFPENPVVHYPGGGIEHPPGTLGAAELAVYAIDGQAVADVYTQGMRTNHRELETVAPGFVDQVRRIYTHQAAPALVDAYYAAVGLGEDKAPTNVRRYGNLVSVATLRLLHEDLQEGLVGNGDRVCLSVAGAGPERGAALFTVRIPSPLPPRYGQSSRSAPFAPTTS